MFTGFMLGCGKAVEESSSLSAASRVASPQNASGQAQGISIYRSGGTEYFACPSNPGAFGGRLDVPGSMRTASIDNQQFGFIWFEATSNPAAARRLCSVTGASAGQFNSNGKGCTCIRAVGSFSKAANGVVSTSPAAVARPVIASGPVRVPAAGGTARTFATTSGSANGLGVAVLVVPGGARFPACPSAASATTHGGRVIDSATASRTSDGAYRYLYFQGNLNATKAANFCAAGQRGRVANCSCLRR